MVPSMGIKASQLLTSKILQISGMRLDARLLCQVYPNVLSSEVFEYDDGLFSKTSQRMCYGRFRVLE
jgi:hypothetical protein